MFAFNTLNSNVIPHTIEWLLFNGLTVAFRSIADCR